MAIRRVIGLFGLAALVAATAAQSPYEEFKLRTHVLAEYDRDRDGQLAPEELRAAIQRTEGTRAALLQELALGTPNSSYWGTGIRWGLTADEHDVLRYAGRWMACIDALPVIGPTGLVTDASRVRDLTPWELAGGPNWLNPTEPVSPAPTQPTIDPLLSGIVLPLGWRTVDPSSAASLMSVPPTQPPVMQIALGHSTPPPPIGLPTSTSPATAVPTSTSPTAAVANPLARLSATPGTNLPSTPTGPSSAQARGAALPGIAAQPGTAAGANVPTLKVDASIAAKASTGTPRFQLGTTKVVAIDTPTAPRTTSVDAQRQRPKAVPQAAALGPTRVVPPSPTRAGILTTRPASNYFRRP